MLAREHLVTVSRGRRAIVNAPGASALIQLAAIGQSTTFDLVFARLHNFDVLSDSL